MPSLVKDLPPSKSGVRVLYVAGPGEALPGADCEYIEPSSREAVPKEYRGPPFPCRPMHMSFVPVTADSCADTGRW